MNIVLDVVEAIVFHPFMILYAMLCVKHEEGRDPAGWSLPFVWYAECQTKAIAPSNFSP